MTMTNEKCPVCDGWGVVQKDVPYTHPDFGKRFPCPNCQTYQDKRLERLRQMSRLDQFEKQTFETFTIERKQYSDHQNTILLEAAETVRAFAEEVLDVRWLVLVGGTGTGKTHLAAAAGHYMLAKGKRTVFVTAPDLLDHLRATFAPQSDVSYDQEFELLCNVDLLILDDVGAESSSGWAQEKLYQIINNRYNRELLTIFTTNLNFSMMENRIASRLQDRRLAQVLILDVPDARVGNEIENTDMINLTQLRLLPHMRFEALNYDVPDPKILKQAVRTLQEMVAAERGFVVLVGDNGTGKTHLGAAAGHLWVETYGIGRPILVSTFHLMDYLRATFNTQSLYSFERRFLTVCNAPLLILDDYKITQRTSDWVREKLAQIIDYRYLRQLPTVIISGVSTMESMAQFQPDVYSRLTDHSVSKLFVLPSFDYRKHMRGNQSSE